MSLFYAWSTDKDIRFKSSTGGLLNGLSLYLLETNKVKVRILGYHNPSRKELSTYDLPWATVMMPNTASQRSGIGMNHQLQVNGWVVGFFMDGASAQIPIIVGTIGDENPDGAYKTEFDGDEPFPKLVAQDYSPEVHGGQGSGTCLLYTSPSPRD